MLWTFLRTLNLIKVSFSTPFIFLILLRFGFLNWRRRWLEFRKNISKLQLLRMSIHLLLNNLLWLRVMWIWFRILNLLWLVVKSMCPLLSLDVSYTFWNQLDKSLVIISIFNNFHTFNKAIDRNEQLFLRNFTKIYLLVQNIFD